MALRTVSESLEEEEEEEASLSARRRRFFFPFLPSLRFFRSLRSSLLLFLLFLLLLLLSPRRLLLLLLEPRLDRRECESVNESLRDDEREEEEEDDDDRERRRRWCRLASPERSERRGLRLASRLRSRGVGDRDLGRPWLDALLLRALAPGTGQGDANDAATYALARERLRDRERARRPGSQQSRARACGRRAAAGG